MKNSVLSLILLCLSTFQLNGQSVSGQVFCDPNADGLKEASSIGISGLEVSLYHTSGDFISATNTGVDGIYLFEDVVGDVYITVDGMGMNFSELFASGATTPDGSSVDSDAGIDGQTVTVTVANEDVTLDVGLYGSGTITGNIWLDTNGSFMFDDNFRVTDYKVQLLKADNPNVIIQTNTATGDLGTYLFGGLAPGEYIVQVAEENFDLGGPLSGTSGCPQYGDPNINIETDDNGMDGNPVRTDVIFVLGSCAPNFTERVPNVDFCFYFSCGEESQFSRPTCEEASEALICDIGTIVNTCHRMPEVNSPAPQPNPLCPSGGASHNISWLGFKAPSGNYDLMFTPFECIGNADIGVQFGIYTDCNFTDAIYCDPNCNVTEVIIPSVAFEPGEIYYLFIDGCFGTVCSYEISVDGQFSYEEDGPCFADEYTPFSETTDWYHSYGDIGGSGTFWYEYQRDTVINGQTYMLIIDPELTFYDPVILRENIATRQVFMWLASEGSELLYYDFSLEVGDEFVSPGINTFSTFTVESITYDSSGIRPLKVWHMRNQNGFPLSYTEGVGGDHIDYARYLFISDPVFNIDCAYSYCEKVRGNEMCSPNLRHASDMQTVVFTACVGWSIIFGDSEYFETGIYIDSLENSIGCDSIITLDLTIIETLVTNIDTLVCGDEFMTYTSSGTYTSNFVSNNTGCDSIVILNLTLVTQQDIEQNVSICEGEVILVNGEELSSAGTYIDTLLSPTTGCIESIMTTILTVEDVITTSVDTSICSGESYLGFDTAGTYTIDLGSTTGCDSVLTLSLSITEPLLTSSEITFCEGDSAMIGDVFVFMAGVYQDTVYDTQGCIETLATYNLTVLPADDPLCTVATSDELAEVEVYPNPASDWVNIYGLEQELTLKMYSMDGRLVKHVEGKRIDVSQLNTGLYLLFISTDQKSTIRKLLVN